MSKQKRKRYKPEEKFKIVKEVITKAKTVADICEECMIHPNQFYRWQKEFFESALEGFQQSSQGRTQAAENREKKRLESDIKRMKDVITELASENIELKKKDMD